MAELGAGAGTGYPAGVDTRQTYQNKANPLSDGPTRMDAELVNDLLAAVVAIEQELGVTPRGAYADVALRLATLENALSLLDPSDYVKRLGKAGGQTVYGGTAAGEALSLGSTTNQTKGVIEVLDPILLATANALPELYSNRLINVQGTMYWNGVNLQDHGALGGVSDDDHLHYHTDARGDARYAPIAAGVTGGNAHDHSGGDGAHVDHGGLAGLGDDDHSQYHTDARGDARYAPIAKGVTNGDAHDHSGGDGAQVDHGGLGGLSDDDHPQYLLKADAIQLIAETVLESDTASVTFSSVPGTYRALMLRVFGSTDKSTQNWDNVCIAFNDDVTAHYAYQFLAAAGATPSAGEGVNQNYAFVGQLSTVQNATDLKSGFTAFLDGYAGATHKSLYSVGAALMNVPSVSGNVNFLFLAGQWTGTDAITEIDLWPYAGTKFTAGSVFSLWGVPVA